MAEAKKLLAAGGFAKGQELHWGKGYLARYHYDEEGGFHKGCSHMFASLCHNNVEREGVTPWFMHTDWLDYTSRLVKAHEGDEEKEMAFHSAVKQLHQKVLEDR